MKKKSEKGKNPFSPFPPLPDEEGGRMRNSQKGKGGMIYMFILPFSFFFSLSFF